MTDKKPKLVFKRKTVSMRTPKNPVYVPHVGIKRFARRDTKKA